MKTSDFYYDLPKELIAQHPLENRTSSRLLILDRKTGEMNHKIFSELLDELNSGDVLVMNDSRVIPARLFGNRPGKEEKIETLLLKRVSGRIWECLVRPGKKMKPGGRIEYGDGLLTGIVKGIGEDGTRFIEFKFEGIFEEVLDKLGRSRHTSLKDWRTLKDIRRFIQKIMGQQLPLPQDCILIKYFSTKFGIRVCIPCT
jgi:S-adenosylmethionine:tRNA ribosyltransferase-isomerase